MTPRATALHILSTTLVAAWAAGASAMFAAEALLFTDLPRPPLGYVLQATLASALRVLAAGVVVGVLIGLVTLVVTARARAADRARVCDLVRRVAAALAVLGLFLPAALLVIWQRRPGLVAGVVIAVAGMALALAAARRPPSGWRRFAGMALAVCSPFWLTALVVALPFPGAPGAPLSSAGGERVVILGLDGASWSVMDGLLERGELPRIAGLMRRGAHGPLRSLEPTYSNRVWTSAATGVVPDRHGITDFFFDRRFIRVPTIWDLVDAQGGRVGLFEYLVTDPPMPYRGFVLPGWMANRPTDTHPPRLLARLRVLSTLHHPALVARWLATRGWADPHPGYREFVQTRLSTTAFLALHRRFSPDLSACVWYGADRLGHRLWRHYEPSAFDHPAPPSPRAAGAIPAYYRWADREVGRVVNALDDGRTLFVLMSDHGMGPMAEVEISGFVRGNRVLSLLGLEDEMYVANPHQEMFLNARTVERGQGKVTADGHREVVETTLAALRDIRRAESGEALFTVVEGDLDTVDVRVSVSDAARLTADTPISVDSRTVPAGELVQLVEVSGTHRIDGIVVLAGPGVERDTRLEGAVITDIAPTVLRALGLPIAEDLDGKVLDGAFASAWRAQHPARKVASFGSRSEPVPEVAPPSEAVLERLRGLGYIQ